MDYATTGGTARESAMTLAEFVRHVFVPEHVAKKKLPGRTHYRAILKHVLTPEEVNSLFYAEGEKPLTKLEAVPDWPYVGNVPLSEVRPDHVQRLISAAVARGYSPQTVKHIRGVVNAVFAHAKKKQYFTGDNPASQAILPGITHKEAHVLTLVQAKEVLGLLRYPEKELAFMAILTNMNMAEICGLQWKYVNLAGLWSPVDGELIPQKTIAVRRQWRNGQLDSVNGKSRSRNVPISEVLFPILFELSQRAKYTGPEDFVLVSGAGTPVNVRSVAKRRLKLIGHRLEMPWLSWQVLRRTNANLRNDLGLLFQERNVTSVDSDRHFPAREIPAFTQPLLFPLPPL